jgi:hypothetical protein
VLLLNLLPIIGAVFLATAAVGAVLMHRRWETAPATSSISEANRSPS